MTQGIPGQYMFDDLSRDLVIVCLGTNYRGGNGRRSS